MSTSISHTPSTQKHPPSPKSYLQKLLKLQQQNKPISYLLQKYFEATNDISQPDYIRRHTNIFKDESFIDIWFFYIYLRMHKLSDEDPEDTKAFLKYLRFNGIGRRRAALYILWATSEVLHGDLEKAKRALEFGKDEKNQAQPSYLLDDATRIMDASMDEDAMAESMRALMELCIQQSGCNALPAVDKNLTETTLGHFGGQTQTQTMTTTATAAIVPAAQRQSPLSDEKASQPQPVSQPQNLTTTQTHLAAEVTEFSGITEQQYNQHHHIGHSMRSPNNKRKRPNLDDNEIISNKNSTKTTFELLKSPHSSHSTHFNHHSHTHRNYQPSSYQQQYTDENAPPPPNGTHLTDDLNAVMHRVEPHQETFMSSISTTATVHLKSTEQQHRSSSSPHSKRTKSTSSSRRSLKKNRRRNRSGQFDPTSESLLDALRTGKKPSPGEAGTSVAPAAPVMPQSALLSAQPQQSIDVMAAMAAASSSLADERPRKRRKVVTLPPHNQQQSLPTMASTAPSSHNAHNSSKITVNGKDFTIIEEIGRGGSSRVYKVVGRDRKIFALKRVLLTGHDSATAMGFKNEIALLKELQREQNIIQLIDYEEKLETQELLLLMECGDIDLGGLLRNRLRQQSFGSNDSLTDDTPTLSMNSIRVYWEQMLLSVNAIHKHGIVHGDLKPANFLLVKGEIKLIDFGIAQKIQHEFTSNIVRDTQIGTLNYIPPEALKEVEGTASGESSKYKLGMSADVWSLGCILFQMVTGSPPFSCHKSAWKKIVAITSEDSKIDFSKVGSDPDLLEVLTCCLQRNPQKRLSISDLLLHPFLKPTSQSTFALDTMRRMEEFCAFFGLNKSAETEAKREAMILHLQSGGSFWSAIGAARDQSQ